jgi:hypothetical protein
MGEDKLFNPFEKSSILEEDAPYDRFDATEDWLLVNREAHENPKAFGVDR